MEADALTTLKAGMADPTIIKTADRFQHLDIEGSGFVVHQHTPDAELSSAFMAMSIGILLIVLALFYDSLIGFYICVGSGLLVGFVSIKLERIRKLQVSSEFLSAMFSSVLGKGYRFCFAAHSDGEIVYVNRAFHALFPRFVAQPVLNLTQLCTLYGVSDFDRQRIADALQGDETQTFTLGMNTGADGALEPVSLLVQPVAFPQSYALVRGI
jgi:hypothetical protein